MKALALLLTVVEPCHAGSAICLLQALKALLMALEQTLDPLQKLLVTVLVPLLVGKAVTRLETLFLVHAEFSSKAK
jgi:hypothetical protein